MRRLLAALLLMAPMLAFAVTLDVAKDQGLVGETPDGYLEAVSSSPTADVTALVVDVNQKRRAQYQRIANQNSIALGDVEQLAGAKAIDKTASGHFVKIPGKGWMPLP